MSILYRTLSQIACPTDLHKFSDKELQEVAAEVRQAILHKVSKTGGHFSSNLGTVELTVALYAAYTVPPDKVIWDTGHQAYPHKILTGRLDRFNTLRKHGGLSGFLQRSENECDFFGAGHAGTAISAALGFAAARDLLKSDDRIVAVTGDGAIASGMSWEALNHAGEMGTDLTVVLNDNRMSIAPNVGALTAYFARLRSRPLVQSLAQRAKGVVGRLPGPVPRVAAGLRHSLTHYFAPASTGTLFEDLGFEYIGPIDGHDLPVLLEVFRNVREVRGPIFVHALTVKGKGYEVAEEDARKWHGVIPFDLAACELPKALGTVTYSSAFGEATTECADEDPAVVAITAAMPDGTGLARFGKAHPDRFYDTGIAEQHAVTFAAGLAAGGLKPFCAIYSTFLQRGFDQVLHDVCVQNLPVRFFLDRAGLVGDDGPTHHGAFDLSFLSLMPNMVVMSPRDVTELRAMVHYAHEYEAGPIALRYPRGGCDDTLPETRTPIQVGHAEILRTGSDVTLCAIGSMVSVAWRVALGLSKEGIEADVVNVRFAKPLDVATVCGCAGRTGRILVVEENVASGGLGQQVCAALAANGLTGVEVKTISLPDRFVEHGASSLLLAACGLDAEGVVRRVMEWFPSPLRSPSKLQAKANKIR